MSHAAPIRALVLAIGLVILSAAPAHAGTIVFDFEDGLQGWQLFGATQRVQTQLLGGEWAVFGDGLIPEELAFMEFADRTAGISLSEVVHVTLDAFVIEATGGRFSEPPGLIFSFPTAAIVTWAFLDFTAQAEVRFVAFIDNITFHTIPEPSVVALLGFGLAMTALRRGGRHGS